jgi:hypothetical protein
MGITVTWRKGTWQYYPEATDYKPGIRKARRIASRIRTMTWAGGALRRRRGGTGVLRGNAVAGVGHVELVGNPFTMNIHTHEPETFYPDE